MKGMTGLEQNTDEIKAQKHELGRCKKKMADQEKELAALRKEREEFKAGLTELNWAAAALCIGICLKFGAQVGKGAREVELPAVDVAALERFALRSVRERNTYILRTKENFQIVP